VTSVPLAEIVSFLDEHLCVQGFPDYPGALNGLQVEGPGPVSRVAVAVDASAEVIEKAVAGRADLLVVHHGVFWDGLQPLVGPFFRKVRALIRGGTALYSAHLPLDGHPVVGNAALLAQVLGLEGVTPFGEYKGASVGCQGRLAEGSSAAALAKRLEQVVGGPVRILPGNPGAPGGAVGIDGTDRSRQARLIFSAAVVTGGGASMLREAAEAGLDALITGEAQHHHAIAAAEHGITVFLAGHYATETQGVRAVGSLLEETFGVASRFIDAPTGL